MRIGAPACEKPLELMRAASGLDLRFDVGAKRARDSKIFLTKNRPGLLSSPAGLRSQCSSGV